MPFIEIDTNKYLYYEERGQGMPVIFIHPPGMGNKDLPLSIRFIQAYESHLSRFKWSWTKS